MFERAPNMRSILASVSLVLLAACSPSPSTGPSKIRWDRQTCEQCQMVISERRYAAQVRMPGQHGAHAFDDLGCALLWLDEQAVNDGKPQHEVWVRDENGTQWIDAHGARFEEGLFTPMAYGFRAAEHGISLEEVHDRVRAAESRRRPGLSTEIGKEQGSGG